MARKRLLLVFVSIAAWLVGLVTPAAAATAQEKPVDWPTYGFDLARSAFNPNETTLTPATVPGLRLHWRADVGGGVMIAQPVVAAGVLVNGTRRTVVYEGTEHGDLFALDANDGTVLWNRNLGSVETT